MNAFETQSRKIIHVDMDCFYAAIETRDFPQLRGQPIAVGGQPNQRGVVATCNYEARAFGIHSAMPMAHAIKKCPKLIIRPVRMAVYRKESKSIQNIFKRYTQIIQPLSLDEAFLDVSHAQVCHGSATLIAKAIRQEIWKTHQLTASAGIAPNKFLAKIASDWRKPNGQFVITPDQVDTFIKTVDVKKIFGVGKVTAKKMYHLGLKTCEDLQHLNLPQLQQHFGSFGNQLYHLCRGEDDRPVHHSNIRKSISVEDTFTQDLPTLSACYTEIPRLFEMLKFRHLKSQQKSEQTIKSLYVKVRFCNFQTTTAQASHQTLSPESYQQLIQKAWNRQQLPVRLLGLGIQYHNNGLKQYTLF